MTQTPPESAVILFDGTDLSNWTSLDGSEPSWKVEDGAMLVVPRTGDVISKETFTDHFVHVEFRLSRYARSDRTGKRQQRRIPARQIRSAGSWTPTA